MCKAQSVSNEIGYLRGYISKQRTEEMLSRKEPGLYDLEHCQPTQIAKKLKKSRRFIVRNVCSGKKAKDVAEQCFTSGLERPVSQSLQ